MVWEDGGRKPASYPIVRASPRHVANFRLVTQPQVQTRTRAIGRRSKPWRSFHEARAFARRLKLKNQAEWWAYCRGDMPNLERKPADIPTCPDKCYVGKGWKRFGDWLGTGTVAKWLRKYRPFHEARAFVHGLKLKSQAEWDAFCKGQMPQLGRLPADIPASPRKVYAGKGWNSTGDWLGTGSVACGLRKFLRFREARAFVHGLKLKSQAEWFAYRKG